MKAIIITADDLEHRYVKNALIDTLKDNLVGILIEKPSLQHRITFSNLRKLHRRYSSLQLIERSITKLIRQILHFPARKDAALQSVLGPIREKKVNVPIFYTESVNNAYSMEWIKSLQPDLFFIYGTGIVKNKVLSLASEKALNLHTGISPFYRGSDTYFWALYNRDPLMVGSTVHECTRDVDGGVIFARISVRLKTDDDTFLAFARCVKSGALAYARIAKSLIKREHLAGQKQDLSIGKEYQFADRTFLHDIKMEYLIRSGKIKKVIEDSLTSKLPFMEIEGSC